MDDRGSYSTPDRNLPTSSEVVFRQSGYHEGMKGRIRGSSRQLPREIVYPHSLVFAKAIRQAVLGM